MRPIVQHCVSLMQSSDSDSGQIATTQQQSNALTDTLRVAAFLALTVGCRYYLTSELRGSIDGASDASMEVQLPDSAPLPHLMDLSTVSL
jgi:hypothetical protein